MGDSLKAQMARFEAVFQQYLDVYMKERNLKKLDEMVSENFSGFGTGMDENIYSKAMGMEIFERDIQSAPNELHYNIHRHEIKPMDQSNAIVATELDLKTTIADQEIKLNNLRMMLVMHEEAGIIEITGMHISFPTEVHGEGESYPLKELEERNKVLRRMVDEKTKRQQEIIYQLQEAEEALRDSEEKHRRLFETMAQGVIYQAADEVIISANPAAERILGFSLEQMRGKTSMDPCWKMIKEDGTEVPGTDHPTMIALRTGETVGPVIRGVFNPDKNTYAWLSITAIPLFQSGETKPFQAYATFEDITERKREEESRKKYEKDLEERNLFIQTILDNLPIGLAVNYIDEGKATYINKKFEEIYGWPKQLLENIEQFFNNVYPDQEYREKIMKKIFEDMKSGDPERMIWEGIEITRKDGKKRIISAKNIALYEQNFMISTVQDITENKKLQAQLLQARKMESVGRLAGGVAHDFNNMLGVILGHVELALEKAEEDNSLYDDLKEIQNAAQRSADITKQLLAFARKQTISPIQLDLNDTVESMLKMLRRLIGEDIDLVWQPEARLWPVKMDPSQIDQILANLCVNAKDAIFGVGKLIIETGKQTFDEEYCSEHPGFIPGDFVLLSVSDNGCGMDKDTLNNLFEPFFTTKEVGKGTGLGLATIYGIVKQNKGFINVYSEPGQGSTFKIYLPRMVADEDADKAVSEKKTAAGGTETILLVEDEPSILRITRMMLERKGYSVLSAATPVEAIDLSKTHADKIHLLMTDVVMPEMNGRDLAEKITDIYPDIRLLFMSGYTADVIAHHGMLDEGVAFIQKPFSNANLAKKLRDVLDTAPDKT